MRTQEGPALTLRHPIIALLCAVSLWSAPCLADPLAGARTSTLDNGLTVVLKADAARPVVAVQMLYMVGARNETIGLTGISHFLEHMLFRGTKGFPLRDVTGVIERAGGEWHGYTYLDCTTYFAAAPKDLLTTLLRLEAERMTDARMAADEVEPERGAVFQEYRGYQLDARSDLFDAVTSTLFLEHPYRNNTMGWESDLAGITHEELLAYYRTYYGPGNAVLAIAGDFDPAVVENQVQSLFGPIRAGGADTRVRTVEPPLKGERRLTLRRPGAAPALTVSFLTPPPARSREYARLMVLDAILGSAKGLSFYRHSSDLTAGAEAGPGSRLGVLAEDGPADRFGTAVVPTVYPYQYSIHATPREGRAVAEIEPVIFKALSDAAAGVTGDEVKRAAARILAADLLETDSPVEVAHEMAFWTALGGIDLRRAILKEIDSVTPPEVRALAASFTAGRAVVGTLLPEEVAPAAPGDGVAPGVSGTSEGSANGTGAPPLRAPDRAPGRVPKPLPGRVPERSPKPEVTTLRLPGGSRAIVDARPDQATFVLRLAVEPSGGPAGPGATARLRAAGAALRLDRDARRRLAATGARLSVESLGERLLAERDTLQLETAGPAGAFTSAVEILGEAVGRALRTPAGEEIPLSGDPGERALQMLAQAAEPAAPRGTGGNDWRVFVAIVSPFSPESLGPWVGALIEAVPAPGERGDRRPVRGSGARGGASGPPFAPGRRSATLENISQGHLLLAVPGDEDVAAQEAVAWILHHNYGGRLGVKAIAETGLVYDMDSESIRRGTRLAYFAMGADPAALGRLESALAEVLDSAATGLSEQEVAEFRSFMSGSLVVRLADPVQAARLHCSALLRGEDDRGPAVFARGAADLTRERVTAAAQRMLDPARRLTVVVDRAAR